MLTACVTVHQLTKYAYIVAKWSANDADAHAFTLNIAYTVNWRLYGAAVHTHTSDIHRADQRQSHEPGIKCNQFFFAFNLK